MDGVVYKSLARTQEVSDGVFPLFGFACADYVAKYEVSADLLQYCYLFGAILFHEDVNRDTFKFIKHLVRNNAALVLLVFDINHLTDEDCNVIMEELDGAYGFSELKDVYEDRIVFARK